MLLVGWRGSQGGTKYILRGAIMFFFFFLQLDWCPTRDLVPYAKCLLCMLYCSYRTGRTGAQGHFSNRPQRGRDSSKKHPFKQGQLTPMHKCITLIRVVSNVILHNVRILSYRHKGAHIAQTGLQGHFSIGPQRGRGHHPFKQGPVFHKLHVQCFFVQT